MDTVKTKVPSSRLTRATASSKSLASAPSIVTVNSWRKSTRPSISSGEMVSLTRLASSNTESGNTVGIFN